MNSANAVAHGPNPKEHYSDAELEALWRRNVAAHPDRAVRQAGSAALRRVAHLVSSLDEQIRFGALLGGVVARDGSTVAEVDRLDEDLLDGLFVSHRYCAAHVRGYCDEGLARRLSEKARTQHAAWKVASGAETDMFYAESSIPGEIAVRSKEHFFRYVRGRDEFITEQRAASEGNWPVDRLRRELDELWPHGARLLPFGGGTARPAMMRVMTSATRGRATRGFVHTDDTPTLTPLRGQCSANIYLHVPPEGGDLFIWNVNFQRAAGVQSWLVQWYLRMLLLGAFEPGVQETLRRHLPEPVTIRPATGDLIILHTGRPHAVAPVPEGDRITSQTFIACKGHTPLSIFS